MIGQELTVGGKLRWDEWFPGLETDDRTLREVMETMPASDATKVPQVIRNYENPDSQSALPGAIQLDRHDCIHALLGRGLLPNDEAFVIGVTMGAASDTSDKAIEKFLDVSTREYPKPWKFEAANVSSFRLGIGFSTQKIPGSDLHLRPLEMDTWQSQPIGEIRAALSISKHALRSFFRWECLLCPNEHSSIRLGGYS